MKAKTPEIHVEPYGKKFRWFLISEYNNHVVAQGMTAKPETAYRYANDALYEYLEMMN